MDSDIILDGAKLFLKGDQLIIRGTGGDVICTTDVSSGAVALHLNIMTADRLTVADLAATDMTVQTQHVQQFIVLPGTGGNDAFLTAATVQSLAGLLAGDPVLKTIQLDDFEPDPINTPFGGPPAMKPVDVAAELHRLRDEISAMKARLNALDAK